MKETMATDLRSSFGGVVDRGDFEDALFETLVVGRVF
jgi:hypothetical protein